MTLPIYRRYNYDRKKEIVVRSEADDEIPWSRLKRDGPTDEYNQAKDCFYQSYGSLHNWGYPRIAFIGSSHVKHFKEARADGNLPMRCFKFIEESQFLGIAGLT